MRLAIAPALTLAVALVSATPAARAGDVLTTTTFEGFPGLTAPESYANNASGSSVGDGSFAFNGNGFNNHYDDTFGPYWDGWAISNQTLPTSPNADFMNQYLAVPTAGAGGSSNYAVAYSPESVFRSNYATITLAQGQSAYSIDVANTLYAFMAITQGDGWARAFGLGDSFKLSIEGLDASGQVVGSVDVTLADYTSQDSRDWYVRDDWTTVDLTSLGSAARSLRFDFETTDVGALDGEARTPLTAAFDNFTTFAPAAAVPEPATWALMSLGLAGTLIFGRSGWRKV
ncbi:DUF4465 domain-containing protein [Paludisphaera mucosa]|uniref:DUF4465 domain-containing protein n=1 Tax=Paludisphaera mucosa TaxID=3030827 RepID=A0ABT6FH59_9BACT|nr:DUF4465 domain-containing protein [Paludisphaera mucosa]MDG3006821.1 DUF4465 domain-containing protein [Paludisphaera mucosa]